MTLDEIYAAAITELGARFRFDDAQTLITNPTELEKKVAITDALAEINSFPPETAFTLDKIFGDNADPRVQALIYLGTGKNIVQTLLVDWTQNGFSMAVDEFNVEDRLQRYDTLFNTLNTQFNDRLEKFKIASQKHVRHAYQGNNNPLARFRPFPSGIDGAPRKW